MTDTGVGSGALLGELEPPALKLLFNFRDPMARSSVARALHSEGQDWLLTNLKAALNLRLGRSPTSNSASAPSSTSPLASFLFEPPTKHLDRLTSKMSHASGWRAVCRSRFRIRFPNLEPHSVAHGVTDTGVGSGALLGLFFLLRLGIDALKTVAASFRT